jgi:alkanesulfonate monooxygenase SsuD/methylene tetrahydromethanopterin reductase-like flavin-dependent oxidoreductase (luciferase family)
VVETKRQVRFGVFVNPDATQPKRPLEVAMMIADELGFDLIGVQDHPYQRRFFDTWTLLTAMTMRTERISVFPDVANLPLRPPAVLAKAAASLDVLSGGRLELGLGAGGFWDAIKAMGGPAHTPAESVDALEEAIHVIRLMWSGERNLHFEGMHYRLAGVQSGPVPAHPIGIWLGAYRPRMLAITGRLADGWVPSLGRWQLVDIASASRRIDEAAHGAGRDPAAVRKVVNVGVAVDEHTAQLLADLTLEAGMDSFLIGEGGDDPRTHLEHFVREVAPRVRDLVDEGRGSR